MHPFDSLTDLQSSQTVKVFAIPLLPFDSLTDLQSSQTYSHVQEQDYSLIPLLIYKALKHLREVFCKAQCLIPLLIYKALKLAAVTVP